MKYKTKEKILLIIFIISIIVPISIKIILDRNDNSNKTPPDNSQTDHKTSYEDYYTKTPKIKEFILKLFDELDLDDSDMPLLNETPIPLLDNGENGYEITMLLEEKTDTISSIYFNTAEEFVYAIIFYDSQKIESVNAVAKLVKSSVLDFKDFEIIKVTDIIKKDGIKDRVNIGSYYIGGTSNSLIIESNKLNSNNNETNSSTINSDSNSSNNNKPNNSNSNGSSNNKPDNSNSNTNSSNNNNHNSSNNATSPSTNNSNNTSTGNNQESQQPNNNPTISISKQNALKSAKNYLRTLAFSRKGLIKQLEFEKYSTEDATYAVDNCGANWSEQALKSAKNYLKTMPFSKKGLIKQLTSDYGEQFTNDEATYAVDNCGANWYEQAVKSAKNYLNIMPFSREGLIQQLTSEFGEQFTYDEAVYGVTQNGL